MSSFELTKLQAVTGPRALANTDRTATTSNLANRAAAPSPQAVEPGIALEVGPAINTQNPPVDSDRVEQIREALKDGSYPLVPSEIVDGLIAAQLKLNFGE